MSEPHDPIQAEWRAEMNVIASVLDEFFNQGAERRRIGFALHVWEFGNPDNRVNYISNAKRGEMIDAMQEWLDRARAQLDRET